MDICLTNFKISHLKQFFKKKNLFGNQFGFSLIEIMIVVSIIGLLTIVAIPGYQKYKYKAIQNEAKTTLANLYTTERVFILNYGYGAENFYQLGFHPKGDFNYNVGFNYPGANKHHPLSQTKRANLPSYNPPYRGPLVPSLPVGRENISAIYNYCKVPFDHRGKRPNDDCFLINGRYGAGKTGRNYNIQIPETVSGSDLGQATSRNVSVKNNGYRDVEFMIGASTKLSSQDIWIMTDSKKLINTKSGL